MNDEYVKMCDTPEIQEKWVPQYGDWYFNKSISIRGVINEIDIITQKGALIFLPTTDHYFEWIDWENLETVFIGKDNGKYFISCEKEEGDEFRDFTGIYFQSCFLQLWFWQVHNKVWKNGKWKEEQLK